MKQKEILWFLISTFILVVLWIVLSIYHNSVTSTISKPLAIQIMPIKPNFDKETINRLKERKVINPVLQLQEKIFISPSPTASPPNITTIIPTIKITSSP
ncbi:MAG: hypothetical protein ABH816_01100 [Candidatus Levyibacteriota bacterium]